MNKRRKLLSVKVSCALQSLFAVVMLKYTVSGGLRYMDAEDLATKLLHGFSSHFVIDILLFAAVYRLLSLRGADKRRPDPWVLGTAVVLAVLYVIGLCCREVGGYLILLADLPRALMLLLCAAAHALVFYHLLRLLYDRMERPGAEEAAYSPSVVRGAAVIFLCWLPWLLMNYPCSFSLDSLWQLTQWIGVNDWSTQSPPLSTAILGLCWSVGRALIDENFGAFLYCLLQAICGALAFSFGLRELCRSGASRRFYFTALLFYAAVPLWGLVAQCYFKDFLYAAAFTFVVSLLLPVLREKNCTTGQAAGICAASLLALLLRGTCLLELLPPLAAFVFWLRGSARRHLLAAVLAASAAFALIHCLLYPSLGIRSFPEKEILSLPFQQTASYCLSYPDEVTAEEREAIDAVLVYDQLDRYDPDCSDAIKNRYHGDSAALRAYLRVWSQMFLKHPGSYIETFFTNHWLDLTPVEPDLNVNIQSDYSYTVNAEKIGVHRVFGVMPTRLFVILREAFVQLPLVNILASPGAYTWALWICAVQLLRRQREAVLFALPGLMNILACVLSPLNGSIRYELPAAATLPMVIGWTVLCSRQKKKDA